MIGLILQRLQRLLVIFLASFRHDIIHTHNTLIIINQEGKEERHKKITDKVESKTQAVVGLSSLWWMRPLARRSGISTASHGASYP
jgi:hypothetical protein